QKLDPSAVVVLITAYGDAEMAVKAIKAGATDFVLKPWQNEKLLATVSAAINLHKSRLEVDSLKSRQKQLSADLDYAFHDFIGDCEPIKKVFETIKKVALTDANVLILGENGTGKELVARALHRNSNRADEIFMAVDMGAINENIFESELFGHMKGSFTDAREDRAGRFEVASGGTLFLDEIGNLPIALQAKLLAVLENRKVTRLGANIAKPIDIRLVCASNMSLIKMVESNDFRQDLMYRINTVEIKLPALRERSDDIILLAEHFLEIYCRKYNKVLKSISAAAIKRLKKYQWPGNVRELQHAIERAVIMSESNNLQPEDFFFSGNVVKPDSLAFDSYNLEDIEKTVIEKVLKKYDGNISHTADELGLTRTSLYRRMQKYGL
ncbi:MAG: sigma-54-dependent Fis family transcriptional regulator, partial [candidate division Zixibacteria bacterium]|nr:sigma-54-dependent Fis family transcriptional regulator [candidate division Zixibacteria bacterium]